MPGNGSSCSVLERMAVGAQAGEDRLAGQRCGEVFKTWALWASVPLACLCQFYICGLRTTQATGRVTLPAQMEASPQHTYSALLQSAKSGNVRCILRGHHTDVNSNYPELWLSMHLLC